MEDIPTFGFADCLWCKLCVHGIKRIVGVCYQSPESSSVNDEALLLMFNSVGELADANTCIMIMGDFNLPNVDFRTSSAHGASDSFAGRVHDCLLDNFWKQHVTDFTRMRDNQTPSCLDFMITDDPDIVGELTYEEPIGKSDHLCLFGSCLFANRVLQTILSIITAGRRITMPLERSSLGLTGRGSLRINQ